MQVGDPAAANALEPTTIEYDAGNVTEVAQGNQVTRYEYDTAAGGPRRLPPTVRASSTITTRPTT